MRILFLLIGLMVLSQGLITHVCVNMKIIKADHAYDARIHKVTGAGIIGYAIALSFF